MSAGHGLVEFRRTQQLLRRNLPGAGARVLDVGGGPGRHADWLADDGYDVEVLDPVDRHVKEATALARGRFRARLGDTRRLEEIDGAVDAVLLLGPLYHLPDPQDRAAALREAARVTRPGGLITAAGISRVGGGASDAARQGLLGGAGVRAAVQDVVPSGWTTLVPAFYFHTPAQLGAEFDGAGLCDVRVLGLEGPAWHLVTDTAGPEDPTVAAVAHLADLADTDPTTVGASSHLLGLARVRGR